MVGYWDPEWLQGALNVPTRLFWWYELVAKVTNSKAMRFQPGEIRSGISEEAVGKKYMGKGETYI